MFAKVSSICLIFLMLVVSVGLAQDLNYKPGELIVRFAPKATGEQLTKNEKQTLLTSLDAGTVKHSIMLVPGVSLVKLPEGVTVETAISKLKAAGDILYVEPNYRIRIAATFPDDTRFGELWAMHNTSQTGGTLDADIDAPEAWDIATSSDVIVAVIDSGVDYNHPDLANNMWVNEVELNGDPNVDDDGNGYVDDIYGYDFCTYDDGQEDPDPWDDYGHGTHCAGIIGAIGNNNEGVTGVCWNVKIMALKFLSASGYGWSYDAIHAIDYAVSMNAKVLSNSWRYYEGNPRFTNVQALKDAVEAADANGVLFVAAAGNESYNNDSYPAYPASYDCNNIISVMATNHTDQVAYYSNYGPTSVDIGAPGGETYYSENEGILSTVPGEGYEFHQGTSMATPHVAGACALVWSVNPRLSHLEVKDILLDTVDELEVLDGLCVTGGRMNLYNAVVEATRWEQVLNKVDGLDPNESVLPDDHITYTISYGNPDPCDPNYIGPINDVNIVDYLPLEVDFNSVDSNGIYDSNLHTVTWEIGTLSPGDENSVTLIVRVNELAEPLGTIINFCKIETELLYVIAIESTDVNSWNPGVIYVDVNAIGSNTGMSWDNAYFDLQTALERARQGCGSEIWVAAGTYLPTTYIDWEHLDVAFELVNGVALYGGFAGTETSRSQRNWITNETILSGIDLSGWPSDQVVSGSDVNGTAVIDGFTITMGVYGIYLDGGSPTIKHNKITETGDGIHCEDHSSPNITNCQIQNNDSSGIYCKSYSDPNIIDCNIEGNRYSYGIYCENYSGPDIINCIIKNNGKDGIHCNRGTPTIKNNWIHHNEDSGIHLSRVDAAAVVRNNTVVYNIGYGIRLHLGTKPAISNCIIWGNGDDLDNCSATYSCISDCGDVGDPNITHNICDNPTFKNPDDPNDLHIDVNSPCKDAGDPNGDYGDETDIDGESRVKYGRVDMGADEYYWSPADFNRDEAVNFLDYAELANNWQKTDDVSDYNDIYDLEDNNSIDYNDLALFCEDWLWQPAWTQSGGRMMGYGMGYGWGSGLEQGSYQFAPAKQPPLQVESPDIEELIDWLDGLWFDGDLQEYMTKDEYLEFRKAIQKSIE